MVEALATTRSNARPGSSDACSTEITTSAAGMFAPMKSTVQPSSSSRSAAIRIPMSWRSPPTEQHSARRPSGRGVPAAARSRAMIERVAEVQ